jgi:hypothetical protein
MGVPAPVWVKVWDISGFMQTPQKNKKMGPVRALGTIVRAPSQGLGSLLLVLSKKKGGSEVNDLTLKLPATLIDSIRTP